MKAVDELGAEVDALAVVVERLGLSVEALAAEYLALATAAERRQRQIDDLTADFRRRRGGSPT